MRVWGRVRANAQQRGRETVIVAGERHIDFATLADEAESIAAALHARGLKQGDVISFQLPNWAEAIVIVLAILRIGAIANPIVTIYRQRELGHILRDARAKAIFVPESLRGFEHAQAVADLALPGVERIFTVRGQGKKWPDYEALLREGRTLPAAPEATRSVDELAVILYTSGTSGAPKGVMHSQKTLLIDSTASLRFAGVQPGQPNLVVSPIGHITGLNHACFVPQIAGTRMVLMEEWNPVRAAQLIASERVHWMAGATPFLQALLDDPNIDPADLATLKTFRCGGADVPVQLIRAAAARGIEATRCYGCTEVPTVSGITPGDPERNATTDGKVHDEVDIRVVALDDETRMLSPGESGELQVRGPEMFLGYTDPQQTAEAVTPDGWFRTGDIGRVDGERYVTVMGRRKDIIIRKGENLSAREIEEVLSEHPDVIEVAVIGLPDPQRGEMVTAVVRSRNPNLVLGDITRFLDGVGLARQKYPERLELVDTMPMTPAGKIRKVELRERFQAMHSVASQVTKR